MGNFSCIINIWVDIHKYTYIYVYIYIYILISILIRGRNSELYVYYEKKVMWRQEQRLKWCGQKPRDASSHQNLEKARNDCPQEPPERLWHCQYLDWVWSNWFHTSRLQNCEKTKFSCFKSSILL